MDQTTRACIVALVPERRLMKTSERAQIERWLERTEIATVR